MHIVTTQSDDEGAPPAARPRNNTMEQEARCAHTMQVMAKDEWGGRQACINITVVS